MFKNFFRNIKGSVVVEKILMTLLSISLCTVGTLYINKTINLAIDEQNCHSNIIPLNSYRLKSGPIKIRNNNVVLEDEGDVLWISFDQFDYNGWIDHFNVNKLHIVNENAIGARIAWNLGTDEKPVYRVIEWDITKYRGQKIGFFADVSEDKKTVRNVRIVFEETPKFPNFI